MKKQEITIARLWPKYKGVFESRAGVIEKLDSSRFRTIHIYITSVSNRPNQFKESGYTVYFLSTKGMVRYFNIVVLWRLIRILRKEKVDILHCHKHKSTVYGTLVKILTRNPIVISHVHGINRTRNRRRKFLNYLLFKKVDKIITVGKYTCEDVIHNNLSVSSTQICSIGNSINYNRFSDVPLSKTEARKLLSLPEDGFVFGTVSRLTPVKGNSYLVDAFKKVQEQIPSASLVIAGKGRAKKDLENQVKSLFLVDSVHFLDYREDIPQVLRAFDCFIIPSVGEEGLPRSLIEAMASGIPVIGTKISGIPEILNNGEYGILVPPRDSNTLAEVMINVVNMLPSERRELIEKAKQRIRDGYRHEIIAERLENIYSELVVQKRVFH